MIHLVDKSGCSVELVSETCHHGSLKRSCEICERDERIKEFATELDAALAEVVRLEDENAKLRKALDSFKGMM